MSIFLIVDRCDVPLGFQDGRVLRSMFIASSMYNHYYGPWSARLQAQNHGQTRGGWVAKYNNVNQWWQVDLGVTSRVKRIATQARYDANQWVKSYTLSYSNDGARFSPYRYRKRVKVLFNVMGNFISWGLIYSCCSVVSKLVGRSFHRLFFGQSVRQWVSELTCWYAKQIIILSCFQAVGLPIRCQLYTRSLGQAVLFCLSIRQSIVCQSFW